MHKRTDILAKLLCFNNLFFAFVYMLGILITPPSQTKVTHAFRKTQRLHESSTFTEKDGTLLCLANLVHFLQLQ